MTPIVEARGLVKRFGKLEALAGLDLTLAPGELVALLGPNGAGKSTFVRTVSTLLRPDGGSLTVGGYDVRREPARVRQTIGLAGQSAAVEGAMTGQENLEMVARLYGVPRRHITARSTELLELLGLREAAGQLVRTYSGGMQRKLDLGASLVGRPRLLLLDEPTTGLDPRSRIELWDAIRSLAQAGTDILLTTQYLDEADQLAGRVVIIDHGRVIADGTPAELKTRAGGDVVEVHVHDPAALGDVVAALAPLAAGEPTVDRPTRRVSVAAERGSAQLRAAVRALDDAGLTVDDIALRRPTLDEVFLALTGQQIAA